VSLRRAFEILRKDLSMGPRSPIFLYALVFPVVATVLIQVVFGSLFDPAPRLGIVDEGESQVTQAALALGGVEVALLDSVMDLRQQVEFNDLDAGLVLQKGFDDALLAGDRPDLKFFVGGESLASNRLILAITTVDLIRGVAGEPSPVEVAVNVIGDGTSLPVSERLIPLLVLFAMLIAGLLVPAAALVEEKEKGTLSALFVTPTQTADVLVAKGTLGFLMAIGTGIVTLALNQAFGDNPLALVLILAVAALMALEIGLIVGAGVRDTNALFTVIKTGNIVLYAPVIFYIWPDLPQWVPKIFPTYYFLNPLFEVAVKGTDPGEVWSDLAIALVVCVALLPLVFVMGRRMTARLAAG